MRMSKLEETGGLKRIAKKVKKAKSREAILREAVQFGGVGEFLRKEIEDRSPYLRIMERDDGTVTVWDDNYEVTVDPIAALSQVQQLGYTQAPEGSAEYTELWHALFNAAGQPAAEQELEQPAEQPPWMQVARRVR